MVHGPASAMEDRSVHAWNNILPWDKEHFIGLGPTSDFGLFWWFDIHDCLSWLSVENISLHCHCGFLKSGCLDHLFLGSLTVFESLPSRSLSLVEFTFCYCNKISQMDKCTENRYLFSSSFQRLGSSAVQWPWWGSSFYIIAWWRMSHVRESVSA